MSGAKDFPIHAPVQFKGPNGIEEGHIARKTTRHALVVAHSGQEFRVLWQLLSKHKRGTRKRVSLRIDEEMAGFRPGLEVSFPHRSATLCGVIANTGPRYANVVCNDGTFRVPYRLLTAVGSALEDGDSERLAACAALAEQLIAEHSLSGWSFQFDNASRRAGCCSFGTQVISLARLYCLQATHAETRNTILHEIAHAIVGPKHNHDATWKSAARAIGCSGDRCHDIEFAPPKYIASCPRCGWAKKRNRRLRGAICTRCAQPVVYCTYSLQAWEESAGERA